MADLMILVSSFHSSPQLLPPPVSQSANGLSLIFFYEFLTDPAAHNYSQFCLISEIKKIRLFVKEMYAAPLS